MKVAEIGEFGLIELLAQMVSASRDEKSPAWQKLVLGIGDDTAAWKSAAGMALATTDCLIQDVHFTLGQTTWRDLGWKALAVNLSDIAAMGGTAGYALVSLGLPGDTDVENVKELYRGMLELGRKCGVAIVGGNTSGSRNVFISLSIVGSAGRRLLTRSGARPGDKIAVTGYLGAAAAGFKLISNGTFPLPEDSALRQAFLKPYPRLREGAIILAGGARAAIDISDGLVADLGHICQASLVGAHMELERVPVHPLANRLFGAEALKMALAGGEDYELLFTASDRVIKNIRARISCPVSILGEITSEHTGQVEVVDRQGQPFKLNKTGWEHFATGQP